MKTRTLVTLSILALSTALPACSSAAKSGLQVPAQGIPALATAVAESTPAALPTATAESVATAAQSGRTASYQGISFSYPSSLATDVQVASQPAVPAEAAAPAWAAHPEFLQFNFLGYVHGKTTNDPRIEVYPAADYKAASSGAGTVIDELQALAKSKSPAANQDLPFLPLQNAKQAVHASIKFVQFQNGTGIRYLVQYNQGPLPPINNGRLFYTFQGLTNDGAYYVSAVLPVSNSLLPDDDNTLPTSDFIDRIPTPGFYTDYLDTTAQILDAASPSAFSPDLAALDAVIASLSVHAK